MVTLDDGRVLDGHPDAVRGGRHHVRNRLGLGGNRNLRLNLQLLHVQHLHCPLDRTPDLAVHVQKLRHRTRDRAHRNGDRTVCVPTSCN